MSQNNIKTLNSNRFLTALKEKSGLLVALAALMLIFGLLTKGRFWEVANLINLLRAISLSSIVAFGMTLCIITGGSICRWEP